MKNYRGTVLVAALALMVSGYLMFAPAMKAATIGDSPEISKLLADAKAEAMELRNDSEDMESFTNSQMNWRSYVAKVAIIKEHVNKSGELLAKLEAAKPEGSIWQQRAIEEIRPLLTELAANTETTIKYLKDNPTKIHFTEFREYVKGNRELSTDLEALIRDFVDYGNAKERMERLGEKLEVTE